MGSIGNTNTTKTGPRRVVKLYGEDVTLPRDLVYSNPIMTPSPALKEFEDRVKWAELENGISINTDGTAFKEYVGTETGMEIESDELDQVDGFTHNHPRPDYSEVLGGTFSVDDLVTFSKHTNQTWNRVVTQEGIYTIVKEPNFRRGLFVYDCEFFFNGYYDQYKREVAPIKKARKAGDLTINQYADKLRDAGNDYLMKLHEWLVRNQEKYGYKYALTEV